MRATNTNESPFSSATAAHGCSGAWVDEEIRSPNAREMANSTTETVPGPRTRPSEDVLVSGFGTGNQIMSVSCRLTERSVIVIG
jgi:hypothetical protein